MGARRWHLGPTENEGKKDFSASGGIRQVNILADALQEHNAAGNVREQPKKSLEHTFRLHWANAATSNQTLPTGKIPSNHQRRKTLLCQVYGHGQGRRGIMVQTTSRGRTEQALIKSAINALDQTDGHLKPLFTSHTADPVFMVGFRQSHYILKQAERFLLKHSPAARTLQLVACLDETTRMAGTGPLPLGSCCCFCNLDHRRPLRQRNATG